MNQRAQELQLANSWEPNPATRQASAAPSAVIRDGQVVTQTSSPGSRQIPPKKENHAKNARTKDVEASRTYPITRGMPVRLSRTPAATASGRPISRLSLASVRSEKEPKSPSWSGSAR